MANKTSFINKTVEIHATLSFEKMESMEKILKNAYLDAATGHETGMLETIKELGESLGVDAETYNEDLEEESLHQVA